MSLNVITMSKREKIVWVFLQFLLFFLLLHCFFFVFSFFNTFFEFYLLALLCLLLFLSFYNQLLSNLLNWLFLFIYFLFSQIKLLFLLISNLRKVVIKLIFLVFCLTSLRESNSFTRPRIQLLGHKSLKSFITNELILLHLLCHDVIITLIKFTFRKLAIYFRFVITIIFMFDNTGPSIFWKIIYCFIHFALWLAINWLLAISVWGSHR